MTDEARPPASSLKGRLADVFIPALVSGELEALARRLGNRATVDDPIYGRASSLASLEPMIGKLGDWLAQHKTAYRHVYSTTGVDRDASEGILVMQQSGVTRELPVAVVAERRRLREIELRVYYASEPSAKRKPRTQLVPPNPRAALPQQVQEALEALGRSAIDGMLVAFEVDAHVVDPSGTWHHKRDGAMGSYLSDLGNVDIQVAGAADDGRTCAVEATVSVGARKDAPAMFSFERSNSGLFKELRLYWD
ncbi:MAG TPA: hypothetical protein VIF62_34490 [Labilithrix sp.]|jgi:hypothetical protein